MQDLYHQQYVFRVRGSVLAGSKGLHKWGLRGSTNRVPFRVIEQASSSFKNDLPFRATVRGLRGSR